MPQAFKKPKKLPVQERAKATVAAILEAAVQVLAHEGPLKITTHRIAERAGVSVGTLYQYFPNKQSIFGQLLRQYRERSVAALMENVMGLADAPLDEVLDRAIDSFIQPFFEHPVMARALMQNRDAFVDKAERLAHMKQIQDFIAGALTLRADIPPVPDAQMVAFTLVRTAEALSVAAITDNPESLRDGRLRRELRHLLGNYIKTPRA